MNESVDAIDPPLAQRRSRRNCSKPVRYFDEIAHDVSSLFLADIPPEELDAALHDENFDDDEEEDEEEDQEDNDGQKEDEQDITGEFVVGVHSDDDPDFEPKDTDDEDDEDDDEVDEDDASNDADASDDTDASNEEEDASDEEEDDDASDNEEDDEDDTNSKRGECTKPSGEAASNVPGVESTVQQQAGLKRDMEQPNMSKKKSRVVGAAQAHQ